MITQYVHPTSNITPTCTLHIRTYCTQVCTYVDIRQSTSNAHLKADRGNAEDEVTPIITFVKIYVIKVYEHSPTHVLTVLQTGATNSTRVKHTCAFPYPEWSLTHI